MTGITYAGINETGSRPRQEDSIGARMYDGASVFAVADGLGGHGMGSLASRTVMMYLLSEFKEEEAPESFLNRIFAEGNEALCRLQEEHHVHNAAKTTLSCVAVRDNMLYAAYIGDSRIYIFEKGRLVFQSKDHSVPQNLVEAGMIEEKDIRHHPDRNRLLRALGVSDGAPEPEFPGPFPIEEETAVLLCTDGFWENVLEKEMEKTLKKSGSPEEWLMKMKKIVEHRAVEGHQDNYSAVGVWMKAK